jgi:hypothetical protein
MVSPTRYDLVLGWLVASIKIVSTSICIANKESDREREKYHRVELKT